jgi:hypothetical protein
MYELDCLRGPSSGWGFEGELDKSHSPEIAGMEVSIHMVNLL